MTETCIVCGNATFTGKTKPRFYFASRSELLPTATTRKAHVMCIAATARTALGPAPAARRSRRLLRVRSTLLPAPMQAEDLGTLADLPALYLSEPPKAV